MNINKKIKSFNLDNVPEPSKLERLWWKVLELWERTWIGRKLCHIWYWIRCHTYTRYHIIDCRTPQNGYNWGYQEPSELIWYSCFSLLQSFVNKQMYNCYIDWDSNVEKEILEIYNWWIKGRKKEHDEFGTWDSGFGGFGHKGVQIKDETKWEKWRKQYDYLDTKDDEMLDRLMKIRHYLWT